MLWHVFGVLGMVGTFLTVLLLLAAAFGRGRETASGDMADVAEGALLFFVFFWLFLLSEVGTGGCRRRNS